jgi:phosphatidylglycerophosphatase A
MYRLHKFVSTVGGIGYLPPAPGTYASLLAVSAWYLIAIKFPGSVTWQFVLVLLSIVAGVYSSGRMAGEEQKDPPYVVIDELSGMWLSLLLIPVSISNYLAAFILFRFFDIVKPFGIRWMEKRRNGWGIMLDDILAGIYSNIALWILLLLKLW